MKEKEREVHITRSHTMHFKVEGTCISVIVCILVHRIHVLCISYIVDVVCGMWYIVDVVVCGMWCFVEHL